ncbi:MAG: alkyl hydroperoxide reductase [Bacteroidetes bacterium]|nr:MAG: alkyl hydroperoxide reductase [Bacteroidota bacterium]RLD94139.1 MAG: alkyl hydroperoxide reductase [Bacteroidota bacterium]
MRYSIVIILFYIFNFAQSSAQSVKEIDSDALKALTYTMNDTTYVVNFWATWCSPCVKEIGYFEELHRQRESEKVKVILVSLDFPKQIDRRVIPFLKEKEITADVLLMTDLDYNSWIDRIDPSWSGAIPATLIYNKETRVFLEQELTRDELFNHVTQIKQ